MVAAFNALEALFWFFCAGVAVYRSRGLAGRERNAYWLAIVSLILFGFSDIIEVKTGAWWKPPALMYFKGSCVFFFLLAVFWFNFPKLKGKFS